MDEVAASTGDANPLRSPIQAIDRAVGLLAMIADAGSPGATLRDLSAGCQLKASTARTILASLVMHGLVEQDPSTGAYRLGPRLPELNRAYLARSDLASIAMPTAQSVWRETQETVFFSVHRNGYRADPIVLPSPQALSVNVAPRPPTTDQPLWHAHSTSAGKVYLAGLDRDLAESMLRKHPLHAFTPNTVTSVDGLLAMLDDVRREGYATNVEEDVLGVRGVAAPVRDGYGASIASFSIGYPSPRASKTYDLRMRRAVMAAAEQVSRLFGDQQSAEKGQLGAQSPGRAPACLS